MQRLVGVAAVVLLVGSSASCRGYDFRGNVSRDKGLMPAEQYARYGHEQAELVAAGRELAADGPDSVEAAVRYARGLPGVVDVTPDSLGNWLTIRFKSGWRAATPPIADGKRGAETVGLPTR